MKIIIGADIVPTKSNIDLFRQGDVEELLGTELFGVLAEANFAIFNLEVPLTDTESPIDKCGPNLIASTDTIAGLKAINPYFFTLANNHILDQGEMGLYSTIKTLKQNQISFAGVGRSLDEAAQPFIFEKDGMKVGLYCCAEHEFSIATENTAGANPFDPLESPDHIAALKTKCDYVIVLYHGGKEHYRYPSPLLQKTCRKCVDKGADLVICQHTHCIGCEEKYHKGTIVYGQGNFLFDHSDSMFWQTSLLVCINIQGSICSIDYLPICKEKNLVRMAMGNKANVILADFTKRSKDIMTEGFINTTYASYAEENRAIMLQLAGKRYKSILFRILNKISKNKYAKLCLEMNYTKKEKLTILNRFECETWRELISEIVRR